MGEEYSVPWDSALLCLSLAGAGDRQDRKEKSQGLSRLGSGQWPPRVVQVTSRHGVVEFWSPVTDKKRQPGWGGPGILLYHVPGDEVEQFPGGRNGG